MDENPLGSCQPCSNNIHITYDDNTAAHPATVVLRIFLSATPHQCIKFNTHLQGV